MNITVNKGDSMTVTETISAEDLASLSGFTAKLYIYTLRGVEVDVITGTISGLVIYYLFLNETTKDYTAGKYKFETKIWNSSDEVYTPASGFFIVKPVLVSDPS